MRWRAINREKLVRLNPCSNRKVKTHSEARQVKTHPKIIRRDLKSYIPTGSLIATGSAL